MTRANVKELFPQQAEAPEWLADDWADFLESRRELKKPMTSVARKRMLRKIERLEAEFDRETIRKMLDDSMVNGWQDIYPDRYRQATKPQEPRRQPLSKAYIEANARPGETYEAAEMRLRGQRDG